MLSFFWKIAGYYFRKSQLLLGPFYLKKKMYYFFHYPVKIKNYKPLKYSIQNVQIYKYGLRIKFLYTLYITLSIKEK